MLITGFETKLIQILAWLIYESQKSPFTDSEAKKWFH